MPLSALFYPKTIALIGASHTKGSVGNEIARNLKSQGYRGKLFLVNPKGGKLFGQKILKDSLDIKRPIDLAVIAIPAEYVITEVKKLASQKVQSLVVISAGFKEVGNQNSEIELAKIADENNISLIGPNCLGFINSEINLNASFAPLMPLDGTIAFISQSGALCASVLDYAAREKIGFSKFISVGNKAQTGELELLEYLHTDPKTKIIAIYIEELEEVSLVREIATKITRGKQNKPIIVLKSGRTTEGKKAAMSHTGSLGGSDEGYEALFAQTGMIRAQSIEELFDIIETFQRNNALKNNRVAIITNAGGPGVLTADALVSRGLALAQLTTESIEELKKFLPNAASIKNPIDILGDADSKRYEQTLKIVLEDKNTDAVEIILTPQSTTQVEKTAKTIVSLKKTTQKPIVVTFMGQGLVEAGVNILNKNKIATTLFPESASGSLAALNFFSYWQKSKFQKTTHFKDVNKQATQEILNSFVESKNELLSTSSVFKILNNYGFPTVKSRLIKSKTEAETLSQNLESPVVLKIVSQDINHKSDLDAVVLNIQPKDLPNEFQKLMSHIKKIKPKASIEGVSVAPMVDPGLELILGVKTDANLGKQILVGLGGVYTEVFQDVSWGLAPLNKNDILRMIAHLKIKKILVGFRGHEPLAEKKVEECLARLSQLAIDFPQIDQIDINPLIVLNEQKGAVIVDARMTINTLYDNKQTTAL